MTKPNESTIFLVVRFTHSPENLVCNDFATVDETPDPVLSSVKYNEQLTKAPCRLCLMLSALALHLFFLQRYQYRQPQVLVLYIVNTCMQM